MKLKICIVALLISLSHLVKGQTCANNAIPPPVCEYSAWNWESDACQMWVANTEGTARLIPSPFHDASLPSKLLDIRLTQDYTKAKGWELVFRDFGCNNAMPNPHFVLYNRFKGILRVFVYNNSNTQYINGYAMRLKPSPTSVNRATAFSAGGTFPTYTPERYLNQDFSEGYSPLQQDAIVYVGGHGETFQHNWLVADFRPGLDMHLDNPAYKDATFTVEVFVITEWSLQARIGNDTQPVNNDLTFTGGNASSSGGSNPLDIVAEKSETITGYLVKGDEYIKKFLDSKLGKLADKKVTSSKIQNFKSWLDSSNVVSYLKDINTAVSVGITVFGFVGEALGFFGEETPTETAVANVSQNVTGTIKGEFGLLPINIKLPGTLHSAGGADLLPYYDCTYGLCNLRAAPEASYQLFRWNISDADNNRDYRAYKIKNDLDFVVNAVSGYTPVMVKASFGAKIPNTLTSLRGVNDQIEQGRLEVVDAAEKTISEEETTETLLVQTPPVELKHLKNTSFHIPVEEGVIPFVRIYAVLQKPGTEELVYFVRDYAIQESDLGGTKPVIGKSQLPPFATYTNVFHYGTAEKTFSGSLPSGQHEFIQTDFRYGANASAVMQAKVTNVYQKLTRQCCGQPPLITPSPYHGTIFLEAGEVVLKEGFHAYITHDNGATISIRSDGYYFPKGGNGITSTHTPVVCRHNAEARPALADASSAGRQATDGRGLAEELSQQIQLSPNPVRDQLNVQLPFAGKVTLKDLRGNVLVSRQAAKSEKLSLNLAAAKAGLYLLYYEAAGQTIVKKVMVVK